MEPRREHDAHHSDEDETAEEGVQRGEHLGRRRRHLVHRAHAAQDHRGVEERIEPVQLTERVVADSADTHRDEDDGEAQGEMTPGAPKESGPGEQLTSVVLVHGSYTGSRSVARQPRASVRFSSANVPPCASAIWRQSARPIPEPVGLVVKNGTNRFDVSGSPGPSSSTVTCRPPSTFCQSIHTLPLVSSVASTAFRTMLISSCSSWSGSA